MILKGILTEEDARLAAKTGCKGIIVSNHGARQLDTVPATIEALPEIVRAVGNQLVVMIDGGIRSGKIEYCSLCLSIVEYLQIGMHFHNKNLLMKYIILC